MLVCQTLIPSSPVSPMGWLPVKHYSVVYRRNVGTYPYVNQHVYIYTYIHTHIPTDLYKWHVCLTYMPFSLSRQSGTYQGSTLVPLKWPFFFLSKSGNILCSFFQSWLQKMFFLFFKLFFFLVAPVLLITDAGVCNCTITINTTNFYYCLCSYK